MNAMMINSTTPNILTSKMRDQMYLKHLRQVEKINNRQALDLKVSLKSYRQSSEFHQKSRKKSKQFQIHEQDMKIFKKNQQINQKMKNIKSMFSFTNNKKYNLKQITAQTQNVSNIPHQNDQKNEKVQTKQKSNQLKYHIQHIQTSKLQPITSRRYENSLATQSNANLIQNDNGMSQSVNKSPKSRISLHYSYRKKQQQLIQLQNNKLINAILGQKSAYSDKRTRNFKLPQLKSCRSMTGDYSNTNQSKCEDKLKAND